MITVSHVWIFPCQCEANLLKLTLSRFWASCLSTLFRGGPGPTIKRALAALQEVHTWAKSGLAAATTTLVLERDARVGAATARSDAVCKVSILSFCLGKLQDDILKSLDDGLLKR
jgi:hypothetical protein